MASATWSGPDQHMASTSEDDFAQFLDMGGMHFDFGAFHGPPPQQQHPAVSASPSSLSPSSRHHLDAVMAALPLPAASDARLAPHAVASAGTVAPAMMASAPPSSDAISSLDAQMHYLQHQKMHPQQRHDQCASSFFSVHTPSSVPPTPQSLEMPPSNARFMAPSDQAARQPIFSSSYRPHLSDQHDVAFTPLVSPAVTPLDPHYTMDSAFAVPTAYFSPLTSPAIHAQPDISPAYDHSSHSNNSPIEMELEPPLVSPTSASLEISKKPRKTSLVRARHKADVKGSPIAKRHRRKTGPSPSIASQILCELDEASLGSVDQPMLPMPATPVDASDETVSLSPENLNEMPPPPLPNRQSPCQSPLVRPQNEKAQQLDPGPLNVSNVQQSPSNPHPATPASLMRLSASQAKISAAKNRHPDANGDMMLSLHLPDSMSDVSSDSASNSQSLPPKDQQTGPAKPLVVRPQPPSGINMPAAMSTNPSPQLRPMPLSSGPAAKKTPQLTPRGSRTRSTGSIHASPALLPRISPSIKPLIPGTPGISIEDTASRLLASKSNYQNILEGNTVPGVSYPSELSTNLTSKRTSHKIAEQGRRNRINTALQTMASLLPDPPKLESVDDADKKEAKTPGNVPNSKASVVESAIEYMRQLQEENMHLRKDNQNLRTMLEKAQEGSDEAPCST
ncbi:hypothetical protein CDD82_187 [Ophiocordyceps australis]|uniref:BHLH domain-containing protein n=1 Tax=Ophiocordyceps australis TaxID=1399860 RepID=A0A2C5YMI7_9HYPO|nr:hypothetical protein CDD82_187 [Ophiocordyceps australis]